VYLYGAYKYTCIRCVQIHVRVYVHDTDTCMYAYVYRTWTHTRMCVCIRRVHIHTCTKHTSMQVCIIRVYTYIDARMHTSIHMYMCEHSIELSISPLIICRLALNRIAIRASFLSCVLEHHMWQCCSIPTKKD
jgi:hypothetical protein